VGGWGGGFGGGLLVYGGAGGVVREVVVVGAGGDIVAGLWWGVMVGGRVGAGDAAALVERLDLLDDVERLCGLERVR
jgi:hypothetical protein